MIAEKRKVFSPPPFFFFFTFLFFLQARPLRAMAARHTAMCRPLREHTSPGGTCGTVTCRMPSSLGITRLAHQTESLKLGKPSLVILPLCKAAI